MPTTTEPEPIDESRYVKENPDSMSLSSIEHLDGVPWHQAPIPPKNHVCWAQTKGWTSSLTQVVRCACGAIALDRHVWRWAEKNHRSKP